MTLCHYIISGDNENRPWVRIASSVLGFITRPLIEAKHAGSDAYPGIFKGAFMPRCDALKE
jgi:hypothetical protein